MDTRHKRVLTISLLVLTVVGGFALRTVMNVDQAQTEDGDFLLSGNDPYYHKHAVDEIVEDWEHLEYDPMLNYPVGQTNPNPPLYEWSIAIGSEVIEPFTGSSDEAVWWSTLYSPAVWGALTIIPVFMIARMFAGNWGGLLAGFLVATAPEHMSRTSLGFADHEALVFFFIATGFYFLLSAIEATGRPTDRRRLRELPSAFRDWLFEERRAAGSAIIAGTSFAAIGLAWKGFPYVFGVVLAYAGLQYLVNHYQDKDIARPAFVTGTALGLAALLSLPYYLSFDLLHFWYPAVYLFVALAALSVYFVAVQRYPSVLVIPGLLGVAGVFAVIMFFVFPDLSRALLSRLVYFRSNLLYETIAEARPAGLSNLSFTVGPIPFFLFVGGIVALAWRAWQDQQPAILFFLTWASIDFVMGIAAIRFLSLIAPTIAILSAVATIWLLDMVDLPSLTEAYQRTGGRVLRAFNPMYGVVGAVLAIVVAGLLVAGGLAFYILAGVLVYGYLHFLVNDSLGLDAGPNAIYISVVLFLALLVIGPNAALGMDAAVPSGYENERVQDARAKALTDVTETAQELGLTDEEISEVQTTVNESRSRDDFRSGLEDAGIRLGFSEETVDELYEAGEDEFSTISFYRMRMGAFGQSFLPGGWHDALSWLAEQDQDQPPAERPGQVAWWDYGHWTISEGKHPAVADNFQNGYKEAGRWLVAQNETRSVQLLGARQAEYFEQNRTIDEYEQTLTEMGIAESEAERLTQGFLDQNYPFIEFSQDEEENLRTSVEWVSNLEEITDKRIRYGAVDNRMLPVDDPNTPRIERPSIFYAPVTLAEKNPDNFVETQTVDMDSGQELTQEEIRQLQQANPDQQPNIGRQLKYKEPFFKSMYYRAYMGLPVNEPQSFRGQEIPRPFSLDSFEEFYRQGETMLMGSGPLTGTAILRQPAAPGFGLDHHRLVQANDEVRILRYFPGASVEGEVTLEGEPAEGLRVTAFDDAGELVLNASRQDRPDANESDFDVPHDSAVVGPNGTYDLVAPFATTDRGVEIRVTQNEATGPGGGGLFGAPQQSTFTIANKTLDISLADAEEQRSFTADFDIEPATVTGTAFHDVDRNGTQEAGEEPIRNATIAIGEQTAQTDEQGRFEVTDITPGRRSVSGQAEGYQVAGTPQLELRSGDNVTENVTFELEPVPANATVQDEQGTGVPNVQAQFSPAGDSETAQEKTGISRRNGTLAERSPQGGAQQLTLQPGEYSISGNGTNPRTQTTYEITGFAVTGGTGVSQNDAGNLVIEPDAQDVELAIRVETQN
jgi:asparagine N-glycosylation enzyme membrane subunit Stt3